MQVVMKGLLQIHTLTKHSFSFSLAKLFDDSETKVTSAKSPTFVIFLRQRFCKGCHLVALFIL